MKLMTLPNLKASLALLNLICYAALAPAQTEKATLILQGGEEIACQIKRIAHGYIYFEAASKSLVFKYGDFIEIEKIAAVRLNDGRTLTMTEYLQARGIAQPAESPRPSRSSPRSESASPNLPPPSGPGMRLTKQLAESAPTQNSVGLRLPDLPPPPAATELDYLELANLLAEAGLAGKLLNEINSGVLTARALTKTQKELLNVMAQSPVWIARKSALREAQRAAEGEFNTLTQNQPDWHMQEFRFRPTSSKHAFAEFVQFLHAQNVVNFQDKWQQVETLFGNEAAAALRDILNNYDDWYFLFGEALEKR